MPIRSLITLRAENCIINIDSSITDNTIKKFINIRQQKSNKNNETLRRTSIKRSSDSHYFKTNTGIQSRPPKWKQALKTQLTLAIYLQWSYLSFNKNDPVTYKHRFAVYMKQGLPFAHDLSLCNFKHSHLCSPLASNS